MSMIGPSRETAARRRKLIDIQDLKLGRGPTKRDPRTLKLAKYAAPMLPTPPSKLVQSAIVHQPWPMDGNDRLGDCVVAGAAHMVQLWSAMNQNEIVFPEQMVVQLYMMLTRGQDTGLVMLDFLNYWRKQGLGGQHPWAFAAVEPSDHRTFKIGMELFGGLYLGLGLPLSAQDQIGKGKTWTVVNSTKGKSGSWGGHCVNAVDFDGRGVTCVTWGRLQKMTWGFVSKYVEEAYAIIPQDFVARGNPMGGFDLQTLQADLAAITKP